MRLLTTRAAVGSVTSPEDGFPWSVSLWRLTIPRPLEHPPFEPCTRCASAGYLHSDILYGQQNEGRLRLHGRVFVDAHSRDSPNGAIKCFTSRRGTVEVRDRRRYYTYLSVGCLIDTLPKCTVSAQSLWGLGIAQPFG